MSTQSKKTRRGNARAAKRSQRTAPTGPTAPYISRRVPVYDLASEEQLVLVETNAERVLEEIGIDFKDDPGALDLFRDAGATIDGERVRFPQGLCREIIRANAPRQFTQHARNPARNVEIGGDHMVLVPAYGPPFVHDLDKGRRYATLTDFEQFKSPLIIKP